jgi:hypothetical protein
LRAAAHWYGALVGTSFQLTEALWLSARGEVMRDSKGYRIADGDEVTAYTLTGTLGYNHRTCCGSRFATTT